MTTNAKPPVLTRKQISSQIERIRKLKIAIDHNRSQASAAVEKIVNKFTPKADALEKELLALDAGVCAWAMENRKAEFGEDKSIAFGSGASIEFRLNPKALVLEFGWTDEQVVKKLKRLKLTDYIRVKESIDKTKLIADVDTKIPAKKAKKFGVVIEQKEQVTVKVPLATAGKEAK